MGTKIMLGGEEMSTYSFEHQIAGRYGKRHNKELICTVEPAQDVIYYEVKNNHVVVYGTFNFSEACAYYENL